jgi:hypothetical protein
MYATLARDAILDMVALNHKIPWFSARDHFFEESRQDGVYVLCVTASFQTHFGFLEEVRIEPMKVMAVQPERFAGFPELGEYAAFSALKLGHVWILLRRQGPGIGGILATDGHPNFLPVYDFNRRLRWVTVSYNSHGPGWVFDAPSPQNIKKIYPPHCLIASRAVLACQGNEQWVKKRGGC